MVIILFVNSVCSCCRGSRLDVASGAFSALWPGLPLEPNGLVPPCPLATAAGNSKVFVSNGLALFWGGFGQSFKQMKLKGF